MKEKVKFVILCLVNIAVQMFMTQWIWNSVLIRFFAFGKITLLQSLLLNIVINYFLLRGRKAGEGTTLKELLATILALLALWGIMVVIAILAF